jgi:hypothetical protein
MFAELTFQIPFPRTSPLRQLSKNTVGVVRHTMRTGGKISIAADLFLLAHMTCLAQQMSKSPLVEVRPRLTLEIRFLFTSWLSSMTELVPGDISQHSQQSDLRREITEWPGGQKSEKRVMEG